MSPKTSLAEVAVELQVITLNLNAETVKIKHEGKHQKGQPVIVTADEACTLEFDEVMQYGDPVQSGRQVPLAANTPTKIYPLDDKKKKFDVKRSSTGPILTPDIAPTIPF